MTAPPPPRRQSGNVTRTISHDFTVLCLSHILREKKMCAGCSPTLNLACPLVPGGTVTMPRARPRIHGRQPRPAALGAGAAGGRPGPLAPRCRVPTAPCTEGAKERIIPLWWHVHESASQKWFRRDKNWWYFWCFRHKRIEYERTWKRKKRFCIVCRLLSSDNKHR